MALTLTIDDNAIGTVTFGITGSSDDFATVNIYAAMAGTSWALCATRMGDGAVSATLSSGYYYFYTVDQDANLYSAVSERTKVLDLTSEDSALHYQCLLSVQVKIQDLLLNEIDPDSVLVRKMPIAAILEADARTTGPSAAAKLPGILVCPGNQEKLSGGTNGRDDIGYTVSIVVLADDAHQHLKQAELARYLRWREQIIGILINQRLLDVAGQPFGRLEADPIIDKRALLAGTLQTAMTFRYSIRRTRGVI